MKVDFTNAMFKLNVFRILFAFTVIAALISLQGCSSGLEQTAADNFNSYSGDKSFSFKEEGSNWIVDFKDDKIFALYKDGVRLPDDEIDHHKTMIYEKLDGLKSVCTGSNDNVHCFHFDIHKFDDDIKKFKDNFDKDKYMHFKLEFDKDEFDTKMKELGERLKEFNNKKIELYFDSEKFRERIKKLEEKLESLPN